MSKNTMSLEELRSSYVEISDKIKSLWKSGVKNKLSLAKEINTARVNLGMCDTLDGTEVYTKFLSDLPFDHGHLLRWPRLKGRSKKTPGVISAHLGICYVSTRPIIIFSHLLFQSVS